MRNATYTVYRGPRVRSFVRKIAADALFAIIYCHTVNTYRTNNSGVEKGERTTLQMRIGTSASTTIQRGSPKSQSKMFGNMQPPSLEDIKINQADLKANWFLRFCSLLNLLTIMVGLGGVALQVMIGMEIVTAGDGPIGSVGDNNLQAISQLVLRVYCLFFR